MTMIEAKVKAGELVGEQREKRITFTKFAEIYKARHYHNLAPSTQMRTDYAILKLEPIFGHHVIQSIRPEDVERFKSSRFKSHPHHITSPYVLHNPDGSPWKNPRKGFGEMLSKAGVPVIRNA